MDEKEWQKCKVTAIRHLILNLLFYGSIALIVAGALRLSTSWGMITAGLMGVGVFVVYAVARSIPRE